jgi:hypothetical protein
MKHYTVEKDWKSHGFRCVVLALDIGHRCGYVGVPFGHILFALEYNAKIPEYLKKEWERVLQEPIGKRGAIDVMCLALGGDSRIGYLFDVHGGITFSDGAFHSEYPVPAFLWWYGFDCAHHGDGKDFSIMSPETKEREEKYGFRFGNDYPVRSLNYCIEECENLAKQLEEINAIQSRVFTKVYYQIWCGKLVRLFKQEIRFLYRTLQYKVSPRTAKRISRTYSKCCELCSRLKRKVQLRLPN